MSGDHMPDLNLSSNESNVERVENENLISPATIHPRIEVVDAANHKLFRGKHMRKKDNHDFTSIMDESRKSQYREVELPNETL